MHSPEDKYKNDPNYRALVDAIHAHLAAAKFTPSEVREAATLACIKFETWNPVAIPPEVEVWLKNRELTRRQENYRSSE